MANRFRAAVKTTTITVSEFEYETKYQGHGSIIRAIAAYPGLDEIIEDGIDALISRSSGNLSPAAMQSIMDELATTEMSVGAIGAKVITAAPDLVADLIAAGAVLHDGETREDFVEWLESLTITEILSIAKQWYAFNFEGGLGPFVRELTAMFGKGQSTPAKVPDPKPAAAHRGLGRSRAHAA